MKCVYCQFCNNRILFQIVTSAHYMLSDLYVPADTDPASPRLDGQLNDEDCDNGPQSGMEYGGGGNGSTDEKLYEGDGLFGSYRGADKFLARPGRKQATATEDFDFHISYL